MFFQAWLFGILKLVYQRGGGGGGMGGIRRGSESCFSHSQMIRNMLRVNVRRAVTSGAATEGRAGCCLLLLLPAVSAEEVSNEKPRGGGGVSGWRR